jgi:hypothetical protein
MPKIESAERRDRKQQKKKFGMRESGRESTRVIREQIIKRAQRAKERMRDEG